MRVAVTGANGFVGRALARQLACSGHEVLAYSRHPKDFIGTTGVIPMTAPDLRLHANWQLTRQRIDVFVHCAARVHVMNDSSADPLANFRRANVEGTINLALQAASAGARRFVFLSSIKVVGDFTLIGRPLTADDIPAPGDPYAVSKYEAEQALSKIAADTGMEVVIIRPPLVYGRGVKANFELMMRWLTCGVPLPFAAVTENRRSLVALDNLVDLIVTCLNHPRAADQTFLVSDAEDLSTADLLTRMGAALGHPARLFYMPPMLLKFGTRILKNPGIYNRLCGSLQLDTAKTHHTLGWTPLVSVEEGLRRAAEGFRL
jgi:nucleoside-diphosphate-sugar epimerase